MFFDVLFFKVPTVYIKLYSEGFFLIFWVSKRCFFERFF